MVDGDKFQKPITKYWYFVHVIFLNCHVVLLLANSKKKKHFLFFLKLVLSLMYVVRNSSCLVSQIIQYYSGAEVKREECVGVCEKERERGGGEEFCNLISYHYQ